MTRSSVLFTANVALITLSSLLFSSISWAADRSTALAGDDVLHNVLVCCVGVLIAGAWLFKYVIRGHRHTSKKPREPVLGNEVGRCYIAKFDGSIA